MRRIGDGRTRLLRLSKHGIDVGPDADEVAKTELAAACGAYVDGGVLGELCAG